MSLSPICEFMSLSPIVLTITFLLYNHSFYEFISNLMIEEKKEKRSKYVFNTLLSWQHLSHKTWIDFSYCDTYTKDKWLRSRQK